MRVALFSTCVVDQLVPSVGLAVMRVLRQGGIATEFPPGQTCCGQPFFNAGYRDEARRLARVTIDALSGYDAVVVPSGSCTAMIRVQYPSLFPPTDPYQRRAAALAERTYEFSEFLSKKLANLNLPKPTGDTVTYHDGCHLLRELGIRDGPRQWIRKTGSELKEMTGSDQCCGFGGTFSVTFDAISASMGQAKADAVAATGASAVVSCDPSCLMQIAGVLQRRGLEVKGVHLAELIAAALPE